MIRHFNKLYIEQDCTEEKGHHENELFFGCKFDKLNGLTLKDCDLNRSQFLTDKIRDAMNFTLSLSCLSFRNVEYSPLLFDILLVLMTMTTGNDDKRRKLIEVVGEDRANQLSRILRAIE